MKNNILDYLELNTVKNPEKIICAEKDCAVSYREFSLRAKAIGTYLLHHGYEKSKVAVFLDKSIVCLESMFGVLYSGSMYCVLDVKSPENRINTIINTLKPDVVLTDEKYFELLNINIPIVQLEDITSEIEEELLFNSRKKSIDTDPAYVLFTSGSTGVPKGTVVSHRSVIAYAKSVMEVFRLDSETNFGSQTPFYFSMSVLDIFVTVLAGATLTIIPKMLFSFPVKLVEYLNEKQINTIYWVPTAMSIVANRNTFSAILPEYLEKILFAGEVMPVKQLNYWMNYLPGKLFANLYGPTEITDTGTYYIVNRSFKDEDTLPIGIPFPNCDVILLTDQNQPALEMEEGEICFRGSFLGHGYYNNPEKTGQAFCQNPLNTSYPEMIYRTGDIGKYNEYGEILYISRKDFQIKRMGYRIELGEIESNVAAIAQIQNAVCIFDAKSNHLVLYYVGQISEADVREVIEHKLVKYMQPDIIIKRKIIPINANGKYDRQKLLQEYQCGKLE